MKLNSNDIQNLDKIKHINIINSITGIKPANLIGTVSQEGDTNLAIFSSVVHIGANPPLLGFILRPHIKIRRDTYENIKETGFYTINHIHPSFVEQAHYTSTKFEKNQSEFEKCNLTKEWIDDFKAPFVKESQIKIGMEFIKYLPIDINETALLIGQVKLLILPDSPIDNEGHIDLSAVDDVGISGLNSYYSLTKIAQYPYARPDEFPDF